MARSNRSNMDYDEARIQKLQRTDTSLSQRAQELERNKSFRTYHALKKIEDKRAQVVTEIQGRQATQERQRQDFIRFPRDSDRAAMRFSQILDDGHGFERTYIKTDGEALSRPTTASARPGISSSRHGTSSSSSSRPRTSSSARPGTAKSANLSRQTARPHISVPRAVYQAAHHP